MGDGFRVISYHRAAGLDLAVHGSGHQYSIVAIRRHSNHLVYVEHAYSLLGGGRPRDPCEP